MERKENKGTVVLITAGKGGVGKTTFAANLAVTLAADGKRVALIDANSGFRSLDIFMGLENRVIYDLNDVAEGVCSLKQAIVKDRRLPYLCLLSAAQNQEKRPLSGQQLQEIYRQLRLQFDSILVDSAADNRENLLCSAPEADLAVILTTPEYASLRNADMISRQLAAVPLERRCFVVNQVHTELFGNPCLPTLEAMSQTLRIPLAGVIPYDLNFIAAANNGIPLTLDPDAYITENFRQMASQLLLI